MSDKPLDIDCIDAIESLYAYLDGELDDASLIEQVEHHIEHCRSCYSRAEMERALTTHIKRSAEVQAPDVLRKRLRKLMEKF